MRVGAWTLGILIVLWSVGPVYWGLLVSLTTRTGITAIPPPAYPRPLTFVNYAQLLSLHGAVGSGFLQAFRNSVVEAVLTTLVSVVAGLLAAYAFVRIRFWGSRLLFIAVVGTLAIPVYVLLVPLYQLVANLHQADTYQAISLILAAGNLPLAVWLLRSHVAGLPKDIEDAARVDGAGRIAVLWKIVIPLIGPGLAGTAVLVFLNAWGAFLLPLVFATTGQTQPLTVVIPQYTTKYVENYGLQGAAGILALIPPALLVILMNRYLIRGILGGAIKG